MKNIFVALAAIVLSFGLIGGAGAQAPVPKSADSTPKAAGAPEVKPEKSKAKASQSGRTGKKPDASIDERRGKTAEGPPQGIEGPDARRSKKSDASTTPPKSKGAADSDVGKEQKKP